MIKIKAQNVLLTLAAFAALFFLLPADKDATPASGHTSQASVSALQPGVTQKTQQRQFIRGHFLHSA